MVKIVRRLQFKNIISGFLFIAISTSVFALNGEEKLDSSAQELKHLLSQLHTYSAHFEQKVMDANNELLQEAKGIINLQQPQKLYWEVLPPNEATLIADGKTLWHIDPFVEQVIALDQQHSVKDHPIMLLAQPNSDIWDGYQVAKVNEGEFMITPKSENQSIKQLVLFFDDGVLSQLIILDQQEQRNQLIFSDIKQNQEISSQRFTFSMPSGFELDDQR
ncbi:outer membrane lipoprotein chaperone LolA [Paraneptunicella aestuarii]|uniref:outer membrane lipoprotein chaperone LolA n=1 Tax=Paraneptunicella aestuarii TaxID=2831148 RepID=UPI001E56AFA5|nr:outer membrane lipoprotein chaperone LolA [Paraneptunicella aestuarii]UAA37304.1 outer membrane lipoprotein chaperone LolA [Paraneptunicella aestuarii]